MFMIHAHTRLMYMHVCVHECRLHGINKSCLCADDYDHGYGSNYNEYYGRGYYGDSYGNFHHSGGSASAAAAASGGSASASAAASGRRLLGYVYYRYRNYHDSSAASAAASASGGDASAAAAAASSGMRQTLLRLPYDVTSRKVRLACHC